MSYVTDTRANIVEALRNQARRHDAQGHPFVAAVHRECADELEASTRYGANVAGVWLGPNGEVKRLVRVRRGAERVLRAVYVWCAMEAVRRVVQLEMQAGWSDGVALGRTERRKWELRLRWLP